MTTGWDAIRAGIFAGESGGDYNALFGYSNRPGGQFAGTNLTDMTVDQAISFSDPSGPYGQWVKGKIGRVATPMGAYQIVGTTLRGAKSALGLRGDEKMTPEMQERLGQYIYKTQGTGAWEGYKGPRDPSSVKPGLLTETVSTKGGPMPELGPNNGPLGGLLGIKRDTSKMNDLGIALMALSSPRAAPAMMQMLQNRRDERKGQQSEIQAQQTASRTADWLRAQPGGAQFAELANVLGPAEALKAYQSAAKDGGGVEYGLNPQFGVDKDGNPVLIQIGKNGEAIQTKLPEGVNLSREPIKLDAGTHFVLLDPITRQPVGQIPKENQQAAYDTALGSAKGKTAGETEAAASSLGSKMEGLETVVGRLGQLAETATYTTAGRIIDWTRREAGLAPREAAMARAEYEAVVSNQILPLLRDTFGAQFTEREGETLRRTLGDPDQPPQVKQAILTAFIEQKKRDLQALQTQAGTTPPASESDPLGLFNDN